MGMCAHFYLHRFILECAKCCLAVAWIFLIRITFSTEIGIRWELNIHLLQAYFIYMLKKCYTISKANEMISLCNFHINKVFKDCLPETITMHHYSNYNFVYYMREPRLNSFENFIGIGIYKFNTNKCEWVQCRLYVHIFILNVTISVCIYIENEMIAII